MVNQVRCGLAILRLPNASVTDINGSGDLAASYPQGVRQRVSQALKARGIVVLLERASRIQAGEVTLESGATLACGRKGSGSHGTTLSALGKKVTG